LLSKRTKVASPNDVFLSRLPLALRPRSRRSKFKGFNECLKFVFISLPFLSSILTKKKNFGLSFCLTCSAYTSDIDFMFGGTLLSHITLIVHRVYVCLKMPVTIWNCICIGISSRYVNNVVMSVFRKDCFETLVLYKEYLGIFLGTKRQLTMEILLRTYFFVKKRYKNHKTPCRGMKTIFLVKIAGISDVFEQK